MDKDYFNWTGAMISALPVLPAFIRYKFCHCLDFFLKTKTQNIFFSVVYFLLASVLFLQAINAIRSFLISLYAKNIIYWCIRYVG